MHKCAVSKKRTREEKNTVVANYLNVNAAVDRVIVASYWFSLVQLPRWSVVTATSNQSACSLLHMPVV